MPRSAPIGNKNARNRRSQRAKGAALAVLENVGKKGKKSLYRILIDEGYSHWTAKNPQQVFGTKSAQNFFLSNRASGGLEVLFAILTRRPLSDCSDGLRRHETKFQQTRERES